MKVTLNRMVDDCRSNSGTHLIPLRIKRVMNGLPNSREEELYSWTHDFIQWERLMKTSAANECWRVTEPIYSFLPEPMRKTQRCQSVFFFFYYYLQSACRRLPLTAPIRLTILISIILEWSHLGLLAVKVSSKGKSRVLIQEFWWGSSLFKSYHILSKLLLDIYFFK